MPFWAGMLTEEQHPHPELPEAIRQASWDLFFSGTSVCDPPEFVSNPGLDLDALLDGKSLLILSRESRSTVPQSARENQQGPTLPITLEPAKSEDFLSALLRTKKAWIEVRYKDGRKEVRPWNATQMTSTSNVRGNLRSRPEFRSRAWQQYGIASLRVSIDQLGADEAAPGSVLGS